MGTLARADRAIAELGEGVPFLVVYYSTDGAGGWQRLDRPIRTLTTLDRFGLVEWNDTEPTLRMLQVPELKRAMGFDAAYKLQHGTRRDQIKLLGNGVCPPVMRHIVAALTGVTLSTDSIAVAPDVSDRPRTPEIAFV
jgi:DNA (cytosine-5)-methyltransferase 1